MLAATLVVFGGMLLVVASSSLTRTGKNEVAARLDHVTRNALPVVAFALVLISVVAPWR